MGSSRFGHLRAVSLLIAIAIGLLSQSVAAIAMGSLISVSQDGASTVSGPMTGMNHCPDCDSSMAVMPGCIAAFCAANIAILEQGPRVEATAHATFPMVAYSSGQGITIRPALGPPRSIRQS